MGIEEGGKDKIVGTDHGVAYSLAWTIAQVKYKDKKVET